jgi:AmmeMemoRadiSam system protein B
MQVVRPPAVAGAFYPLDPLELKEHVDGLLERARAAGATHERPAPKALVVPHAGYVYSGPIAASGYARLRDANIERVILLGPVHRVRVAGIAVPDAEFLETPLGRVPVDREAIEAIRHYPEVSESARAHAKEHSLEVQLPFLQRVLGASFKVVPLGVGDATPEEVARVLEALWGGPETVIVVSSDLSHYLPYAIARGVDQYTAQRVLELCPIIDPSEACGATPVNGLLIVARHKHLHPALLDLRSSGDTAGPRDGVVGYGAFGFFEEDGHAA